MNNNMVRDIYKWDDRKRNIVVPSLKSRKNRYVNKSELLRFNPYFVNCNQSTYFKTGGYADNVTMFIWESSVAFSE